jgi:hypothetical protein
MRRKSAQGQSRSVSTSFFDLNQLELAYVNRALVNPRRRIPDFISISRKRRILQLQKRNLMALCKGMGKEHRKGPLENELKRVLGGERRLSISCFLFK